MFVKVYKSLQITESKGVYVCVCEDSRVPPQVSRVDEEDASSRHSGRRGSTQVLDLKHQAHGGVQWNTLVTGQRQHLNTNSISSHWQLFGHSPSPDLEELLYIITTTE